LSDCLSVQGAPSSRLRLWRQNEPLVSTGAVRSEGVAEREML
jgi:hypothetical protein